MATATATPVDAVFGGAGEYLRDFAPEMAGRVATTLEPYFDPESDTLSTNVLKLADEPTYRPFPAQAVCIEGLAGVLRRYKTALLVGEMGTGKTPIGMMVGKVMRAIFESSMKAVTEAAAGRCYPMRIAISCPNQLVDKWARHAQSIMPDARVQIVRNYESVIALRSARRCVNGPGAMFDKGIPDVPQVWIFPRDKSKLGYAWAPAVGLKRMMMKLGEDETAPIGHQVIKSRGERFIVARRLVCPRCGCVQEQGAKDPDSGKLVSIPADEEYFDGNVKRRCSGIFVKADGRKVACEEPLWRAYGGARWEDPRDRKVAYGSFGKHGHADLRTPKVSPRRIAPSELVHRYAGNYFDLYLADEVHELKGDTLQGQMFADIVGASDYVVMMTGTLTGGYAENLRNLFWRTFPEMMKADGFEYSATGADDFTRKYGVLQQTLKWIAKDDSPNHVLGRGKPNSVRTKALPGIAPTLFTNFLLPRTVFIRLMEMSDHLPPFSERLNLCRLTRSQATELAQMSADFEDHRDSMKRKGMPVRAWSGARSAFLRWPDRPHTKGTVWDYDEYGNPMKAFDYRGIAEEIEYPKERRLRRRLCVDKRRGIKSWVFTNMTGPAWDVTERMVDRLSKYGLRCAVLRAEANGGPNPMDRERWIAHHEKNNDVIISNPELVKTGLDLYSFTAIHFYGCGDNTYTLRQAARRHWRLGQLKPCRVDYYLYDAGMGDAPKFPDGTRRPGDDPRLVKCLQTPAMALMSKKLAASLALEGDFDENGLAALIGDGGEDVASKLARIIAGEIAPDARKEFAEYRRRLEATMPNLGAAITIDPPKPEEFTQTKEQRDATIQAAVAATAADIKAFHAPAAAKPAKPGIPTLAPVIRITAPQPPQAPVSPAPRPERRFPVTNAQGLLESIVRRPSGAIVRGCYHFGKHWVAMFEDPPSQIKPADLRTRLNMLRMLDKNGILIFCIRSEVAAKIGMEDFDAGMIRGGLGEVAHVINGITLADWDRGIRVGSRGPLNTIRES